MMQTGLYDWQTRFEQLDNGGDPLVKLNEVVKWELFCDDLQRVRDKDRKSDAGRKPFDVVLMFKILILQSLYNLSDDQVEFQVRDRLSFMRFLGLSLGDTVPDAKTVWLFREQLAQAGCIKSLFERFDAFLREGGFAARKGQIVDAIAAIALFRLPASETAGTRTNKSKKVRFPTTGARTRNARRIPTPAGHRRTAKTITAIRTILKWMWSIN